MGRCIWSVLRLISWDDSCVCVHASTQVTIRERIADDSTRVDPQRDGRPTAKKGAFGDCGRITYAHVYFVVFSYPPSICQTAVGAEYCPFIVSLYDAYKHQNQLRLVMEYMNGGSLQVHTYIHTKPRISSCIRCDQRAHIDKQTNETRTWSRRAAPAMRSCWPRSPTTSSAASTTCTRRGRSTGTSSPAIC